MKVSISSIRAFKACKRKYELKYIENLEPVQKPNALRVGSNYHELIEYLNKYGVEEFMKKTTDDYSKECAMARAYMKYIYGHFNVVDAEKRFEYNLVTGDRLDGIIDAISDDDHIVEHKSYGMRITEEYEYDLLWDEQILTYMLVTGYRKAWYTICQKPSIRQRKDETEEQFFYRMLDWYDEDTDEKIKLLEIVRTDDDIAKFEDELMMIIEEMKHTGFYYRNTCHCTSWGRRCEYSSVCLNYDPNQQYIDFIKGDE